jgi:hypothetical protein
MIRTESISIQVHPNDEQRQIDLMQVFHWSLLNSQTIDKTALTGLERRDDGSHLVTTETTQYVKLQFSRDLALPHRDKIKKLEAEYFALRYPQFPSLGLAWLIFGPLAWVIWLFYYFRSYKKKKADAEVALAWMKTRQPQILAEVRAFG